MTRLSIGLKFSLFLLSLEWSHLLVERSRLSGERSRRSGERSRRFGDLSLVRGALSGRVVLSSAWLLVCGYTGGIAGGKYGCGGTGKYLGGGGYWALMAGCCCWTLMAVVRLLMHWAICSLQLTCFTIWSDIVLIESWSPLMAPKISLWFSSVFLSWLI